MRVVASQVDRVGPRYVKLWLRSRILRVVGPKTQHSRVVWLVSLSLVSLSGFAGGRIKTRESHQTQRDFFKPISTANTHARSREFAPRGRHGLLVID